jgi:hypothetical protein
MTPSVALYYQYLSSSHIFYTVVENIYNGIFFIWYKLETIIQTVVGTMNLDKIKDGVHNSNV